MRPAAALALPRWRTRVAAAHARCTAPGLRALAASSLLLCAILATGRAQAGPAPGAEEFRTGMQLFRSRDCAGAVGPLESASRAAPRPGALISLGYCYRQLQRFPDAARAYQRYLESGFEEQGRVSLLLAQTLAEEREWRKLHAEEPAAPPAAAALPGTAPAAPVAPAPFPATPAAPPIPEAASTAPSPGATPSPAPPAPPAPSAVPAARAPEPAIAVLPPPSSTSSRNEPPRPRFWTWVAAGTAVASLGTGVALGLMSAANAREIQGTQHTGAEVASLRDTVKWQAQKGNLLVGIGAGVSLVAAGLFVLRW